MGFAVPQAENAMHVGKRHEAGKSSHFHSRRRQGCSCGLIVILATGAGMVSTSKCRWAVPDMEGTPVSEAGAAMARLRSF